MARVPRQKFNPDAKVEFYRRFDCPVVNAVKGNIINPQSYNKRYIDISEKDATALIKQCVYCLVKFGAMLDTGKISTSNDPKRDKIYHLGKTRRYLVKFLGGDKQKFLSQLKQTVKIEYVQNITNYMGPHEFDFCINFINDDIHVYSKVSIYKDGKIYVDMHPDDWFY